MRRVSVPPRRSKVRSCKTRSNFVLRVGRERGDFVEDDRAGASEFETAEFAVDSAGERAAFVAEELAFDERGRKRGAVDFEKGRVAARTEFVNKTRKVVFAGAGFASDEECGGGSGDFFREIDQAGREAGSSAIQGRRSGMGPL